MKIVNAKVFTPEFIFKDGEICVDKEQFAAVSPDVSKIDAKGLYAIPGLIDIHFHGAVGYDFMDGTKEALRSIAAYEASVGGTSICPATMTMGKEDILKACANARDFKPDDKCSSLVGINMEGPFLSAQKLGAQNPDFVMKPDAEFFRKAQAASGNKIKLLAIAPDTENALNVIAKLKDEVLCSIAHTCCDYDTAVKAIAEGATHLTHLYNAMPPLYHRDPGPIAAGSDANWCEAEIICDGIHVHPAAVRAAFRLFGADRMILISDSMMACGLEDGVYQLGGQKVTVTHRKALLDNGTIAGSATNLFSCMKTAVQKMGIALESAVRCATYNPARSIKILDKVGTIEPGKQADLLLLDDNLDIKALLLRGKWLFNEI